jgi:hypothetical protein
VAKTINGDVVKVLLMSFGWGSLFFCKDQWIGNKSFHNCRHPPLRQATTVSDML